MEEWKDALSRLYRSMLQSFLASGARLRWPRPDAPDVSVILVLYNRADLTLRCLRSIAEPQGVALEVLIVDNASSDETGLLLDRLDGVGVIRNRENRGFIRAVNQAARRSRGRHLLLLNNDAELLPGSLAAAVETLERDSGIGAVGGRLILTDGRLQEAGCIVWNDGSCVGHGRGESPTASAYAFRRDVDFVSGAFLLTPRDLFLSSGGLDEAYAPAYYEDADYCVRLWKSGRRVVYEPRAALVHVEFASSSSRGRAIEMQAARQGVFRARHAAWLASQLAPRSENVLRASERRERPHVLIIDDRVPHPELGSGFPRSREMLLALLALGFRVTLYPVSFPDEAWESVYKDVPREVEVAVGRGEAGFPEFLRERSGLVDLAIVSRPHNMKRLRSKLLEARVPVVYDAEALFTLREAGRRALHDEAPSPAQIRALIDDEARLATGAHAVISVSESERDLFRSSGTAPTFVLGHAVDARPTPSSFDGREGLLFVGAIHEDVSPNADAVLWFARDVLPLVRERLGFPVRLRIVGLNRSRRVALLEGDGIEVRGAVADLTPFFDESRLVLAPHRFGAGVPIKVYEAAARGVPVVCSPLVASQVGWMDGRELRIGDGAAAFADACAEVYRDRESWKALREGALLRVQKDCSRAEFTRRLGAIVDSVLGSSSRRGSAAGRAETR